VVCEIAESPTRAALALATFRGPHSATINSRRGCISLTADHQARNSIWTEKEMAREISSARPARSVVLSIAGFDPSSGAGVTADLKVFAAHGLFGMSCITALTVQSTMGVRAIEPVSRATVVATLQMLDEDVAFAGIKIGMLATADISEAVADFLDTLPGVPIVLDPVIRSSSGCELLDAAGIRVMREKLLRRVSWATPNLDELAILAGVKVDLRADVPGAAKRLQQIAQDGGNEGLNVLVTGGHLDRPDDYVLTSEGDAMWIPGQLVETKATHGTGCALSSALLCRIVAGDSGPSAASTAKEYVTTALRAAYPIGRGKGPMNHLFRLDEDRNSCEDG
jgi:hydroxymethylpyrimidine/phosphomethylpyrimidine kinase